jgi:hypothetical protein
MSADNRELNKRKRCCNPFKCHEKPVTKGLRMITEATRIRHHSLQFKPDNQLCTKCRKKLTALPQQLETLSQSEKSSSASEADSQPRTCSAVPGPSSDSNVDFVDPDHELSTLNQSLMVLGESPVMKRKATGRYVKNKARKIDVAVRKRLDICTGSLIAEEEGKTSVQSPEMEIIDQLKDKFRSCTKRSEKVLILTVLPKSWTNKRVANEFGASNYMVRKAKKLVEEKGILTTPNPKAGKTLLQKTADEVKDFYSSDEISRMMPGKKDYVSITMDGKRQHVQKRLVLCNLREAFEQFKIRHSNLKIGFSKFAELRPKECILAGESGTHSVCVCAIHQNFKLMFLGAKLATLTEGNLKHYQHCLAAIQCNPPRVQCFMGQCDECPGLSTLQERVERLFDEQSIDQVEYKQWTMTDRSNLETRIQSADEFLNSFISALPKLLHHDFIAKQQAKFLQDTRERLKPGEYLIVGDFAENYSFVLQDATQSFHWNNLQATIHPFVCYYKMKVNGNDDNEILKHSSFVVISESNVHDTVAVHLFQKVLLQFLGRNIMQPKYVFYFSDGCAAQYKNKKNFTNLCYHQKDFGIGAEWHFFATSHGKGPCDGVGGTLKRLAARASLQRPYDKQIMSARQLYEFGLSEIKAVNFYYATLNEHEQEAELLKQRFATARTIPGTHRLHSFRPISQEKVQVKEFSASPEIREERVSVLENATIECAAIKGYVTAEYDGHWWLACVLKTLPESGILVELITFSKITKCCIISDYTIF